MRFVKQSCSLWDGVSCWDHRANTVTVKKDETWCEVLIFVCGRSVVVHDSCVLSQQHVPSDTKPSPKFGGNCPQLLPPHVPPGHHGGAQEALGLPSGPHPGALGAIPPVGTPPQASPAPPTSVSPPTTPTELAVS